MLALWSTPVVAQEPSPTFDITQVTPPGVPPVARAGRGSWQENCAPCHGITGWGDGPTAATMPYSPTAFADPAKIWTLSPAELFFTTKYGRIERLMPPWNQRLTDEQIWQTVAYAWSLHTDPGSVAAGQSLYELSCANCHGPQGAGDGPDADGTLQDFGDPIYAMTNSQAAWLDGWQSAHPEIGGEWAFEEQEQVLEYIRTFSYVPAWESGYRPGPGVVRGEVTLGSAAMQINEPITITLDAYADFEPVATFTTTARLDGSFEFSELAVDPGLVYLASAAWGGIRYSSPVISLSSDAPEADTNIILYAATDQPPIITIDRAHWIIDDQPGALLVGQIYAFGNGGDETFTGALIEGVDVPVTVSIMVPPEAEQITFDNGDVGDRFRQVGNIYYDTSPLIPGTGTKQVVVRYALPHESTTLNFSQSFLYPVSQINVLIADLPGLQATISVLESIGPQDFQGQVYQIWQGSDLPPTDIEVTLQGLLAAGSVDPRQANAPTTGGSGSTTGSGSTGTPLTPWMVWGTGGLALLVLAGVIFWSWRNGRVQTAAQGDDLRRRYDVLLQRIAELDDLYAVGQLDAATWQSRRAQFKAELLDVAMRMETPA
jgi:mono/diheme cytochrome c family protein